MASMPEKAEKTSQKRRRAPAKRASPTAVDPAAAPDAQAAYIHDLLDALQRVAERNRFEFLAYLIGMSVAEAKRLRDGVDEDRPD